MCEHSCYRHLLLHLYIFILFYSYIVTLLRLITIVPIQLYGLVQFRSSFVLEGLDNDT